MRSRLLPLACVLLALAGCASPVAVDDPAASRGAAAAPRGNDIEPALTLSRGVVGMGSGN